MGHQASRYASDFRTKWPATGRYRTPANRNCARSRPERSGQDLDSSPAHASAPGASPSILSHHPPVRPAPVLAASGCGDQQRVPVLPDRRGVALRGKTCTTLISSNGYRRFMGIRRHAMRPGSGRNGQPPDATGHRQTGTVRDHVPSEVARILIARPRMLPRQVLPRQFYLITRRCAQRQFLLHPDAATNNAFLYCLIVAALRCGEKPVRR